MADFLGGEKADSRGTPEATQSPSGCGPGDPGHQLPYHPNDQKEPPWQGYITWSHFLFELHFISFEWLWMHTHRYIYITSSNSFDVVMFKILSYCLLIRCLELAKVLEMEK